MLKTISKNSYIYVSILIVLLLIVFGFILLFMGNQKLDNFNSIDNFVENQTLNCNQHYWNIERKVSELGNYDISIVHRDIYIFPEINNLFCIGKINKIILDENSIYVESWTNQKVFTYLLFGLYLFFLLLFLFTKINIKFISFFWLLGIFFLQFYFFSSFKNPYFEFITLFILTTLLIFFLTTIRTSRLEIKKSNIFFLLIIGSSLLLLKYIYLDYLIYLSILGFIFLKLLPKNLNNNSDTVYLILLAHISLILGGIDYPLSRNHLNYFPSTLNKYDSSFFEFHYLREMTYPYPLFESITLFFIKIFGINLINFLNYFSYFFGSLIIFIFIKFLFQRNWLNICLIFSILQGRLLVFSLFDDFGWYRNNYSKSFIKLGIGDNVVLTHLFEPSSFDVLVLLVIIFLINKNYILANFTSIIAIFLHTYNIFPIFIIYLGYLLASSNGDLKIISKIKDSSLLLFSLPFIYFVNIFPLRGSRIDIQKADAIMSQERIPMHRLFNGNFSFLSDSSQFNFKGQASDTGFSFEIEFLIFTALLFFLIKIPLLKKINILIFISTTFSLVIVYFFDKNFVSSQLRNLVPWRISSLIYLLGIIYILNFLITKVKIKKLDSSILIFILLSVLYLSNNADINENRLRATYENTTFVYDGQNLINPSDDLVVFGTSNFWDQNTYTFISTSETYYGHPYKPSEIVNWKKNVDQTNLLFNSNPTCKDFENFIVKTKNSRAIFSSVEFIPNSIMSCSNLVEKNYFGYYVFEINKSE